MSCQSCGTDETEYTENCQFEQELCDRCYNRKLYEENDEWREYKRKQNLEHYHNNKEMYHKNEVEYKAKEGKFATTDFGIAIRDEFYT